MIEDRDYMKQPEYHEPHRMGTDAPGGGVRPKSPLKNSSLATSLI
jgi:hypothetical protein